MSEYAIQSIDLSEFPSKHGFEFLERSGGTNDLRSPSFASPIMVV